MQKEETFTEVDPRAARIIGYHKLLDEKKAGARLEQAPAVTIALGAFPRFGVDLSAFELKEALAFQQPNRRDWLLHFQERQPIVADAYRRVSVRVAGNEVTQFTNTVKIPDEAYREARETTLLNIILAVLRILGGLILLSLTIAGFVIAARKQHFPWRRALRWTAVLALVPIAAAVMRWETALFVYDTSTRWETFVNDQIVNAIRIVGVQIGLIFLAFVGIDAVSPQALDWFRREGRARFGRAALVAALIGIGLLLIRRIVLQFVAHTFPSMAAVGGLDLPQAVAIPLPSLLSIGEAAVRAIEASAAVALFVLALRTMPRARQFADAVAIVAICFITLDPGVRARQLPLMLLASLSAALLLWFLVRYVFRENLLAYPLTVALAMLLGNAATLLQNHRSDLIANGVIEIVAAVALALWVAGRGSRITDHESHA